MFEEGLLMKFDAEGLARQYLNQQAHVKSKN
jgi:hypothetical protein